METTPPIVCDLSVLSAAQRARLEDVAGRVLPRADRLRELADGYAVGFIDAPADLLADLAAFIALDRLCCAFLRHALVSDPGPGLTWLELTGGPGAKEAIADDILTSVPGELTAATSGAG
ncbi:MAG TPA: hypothetical protein VK891_05635 [Euzebyales bacterium]|nr:hypothetical protein [Euzebyales bacterium]